ncbi:putative fatty acid transporter protein-like [Trypanosoma cruzi]|nr:putative fatty acid transporter protein-like [Trypanosoma cruzi]
MATTVNTVGRWNWVIMSHYAYITTAEYIKLGCSLGAVQARNSMRNAKLLCMDAWKLIVPCRNCRKKKENSIVPDGINEHIVPLLHDVAAMAEITHGQSVSMTLLKAFRRQSQFVACAQREHQVVFEMATTDAAIPKMKLCGAPLKVTYEEATRLTGLLSEALAWEWYWLAHTAAPAPSKCTRTSHSTHLELRPRALALMLDNSPEFNLIWMAVSEASVWMTFLDALYNEGKRPRSENEDEENNRSNEAKRSTVYHHCSTALINTNLANHRMLFHALECAAPEILVLDEKYVPLLFPDEEVQSVEREPQEITGQPKGNGRTVVVPSCVKRLFLWRGTSPGAPVATKGMMPWMLDEMRRFNEAQRFSVKSNATALDLFDLVVHPYQLRPQPCLFPILAERISSFPPAVCEPAPSEKQWKQHASRIRKVTKKALLRFRSVMPVLHIYTSGTTGLPKAARFSHLRFFAAIFLSSVLPQREKTKEILLRQHKRNNIGREEGNCWFRFKRFFSCDYPSFDEELNVLTVYNCLPMYHTVGCVFCIGHLLQALQVQQRAAGSVASYQFEPQGVCKKEGEWRKKPRLAPTARMVIRSKFSASRFTQDLQQYRVTVFQYIGEILRYALHNEKKKVDGLLDTAGETAAPLNGLDGGSIPDNVERQRKKEDRWVVPFAFGNGLRRDIWEECKELLGIGQVVEFYSSTEGNIFLLNLFDIPGVVGHLPLFPAPIRCLSTQFNPLFPFRVLKYDFERGEVWRRSPKGKGAYCSVGETGEIVGEIIQGFDMFGLRRFDGYHSDAETRKNVIRGILRKNDAYFLSGDLVRFDTMGFVSFVDRVGETFRWKGENVSTTEVMDIMNGVVGRLAAVRDAVVYGVEIPGREGRAGMVKLSLTPLEAARLGSSASQEEINANLLLMTLHDEALFLQNELHGLLSGANGGSAALPGYAIPVCVRIDDKTKEDVEGGSSRKQQQHQSLISTVSGDSSSQAGTSQINHGAHTTTTFKYRRNVLVGEGYRFAFTSNEPAPPRVYVLVTKRDLVTALGMEPLPPSLSCGYVPLNSRTLMTLGEDLQHCGW